MIATNDDDDDDDDDESKDNDDNDEEDFKRRLANECEKEGTKNESLLKSLRAWFRFRYGLIINGHLLFQC